MTTITIPMSEQQVADLTNGKSIIIAQAAINNEQVPPEPEWEEQQCTNIDL